MVWFKGYGAPSKSKLKEPVNIYSFSASFTCCLVIPIKALPALNNVYSGLLYQYLRRLDQEPALMTKLTSIGFVFYRLLYIHTL